MTHRRAIGSRELLAIDPRAVQRDADGVFLLFGPETPENELVDGVSVVHVRGPLDHHRGFGDNYDDIRCRMQEAFACEDSSAVICRLDSPGGVVAGLLDTVRCIRELSESSGKKSIAYVDENAFSAAYALACAFDEIVLPPSAITGSIGVISTMADQVDRDIAEGLNFVTLTSGARKADGHPHVRITEAMIAAEQRRVDKLALQFFRMVQGAKGIPIATVKGFDARLFLGTEAKRAGVADRVATFDELLAELAQSGASLAKRGTPDTNKAHEPTDGTPQEVDMKGMRGAILEQLKAARAALASAKSDTDKLVAKARVDATAALLESYKKVTEKHVEHSKTHEEDEGDEDEGEASEGNETDRSDDPEDDEDDGDGDGDDKKKKSASAAPKKSASSRKKAMHDEEESAESEDDEAEAALSQIVRGATGKSGVAAQGALVAMLKDHRTMRAELSALRTERANEKRDTVIAAALTTNRITKKEASSLRAKPQAFVDAFLEARPRLIVWSNTEDMPVPAPTPNSLQGQLPPDLQRQLEQAASATGIAKDTLLERYRADEQARASRRNGAV